MRCAFDGFPWLDITDKETIRNSPYELSILNGISTARKNGTQVDSFGKSDYKAYVTEYGDQYEAKPGISCAYSALEGQEAEVASRMDNCRTANLLIHKTETPQEEIALDSKGGKRKKPPKRDILSYDQWSTGMRAFHD